MFLLFIVFYFNIFKNRHLSHNQLIGPIPHEIGQLNNLGSL